MGPSNNLRSNTNFKQTKLFPIESRPRMLKDFLTDDSNSCSSSGFKTFPRKPFDSCMRTLIEIDINAINDKSTNASKRLRCCSKKAASTTISAFHAMINTVKNIPFTAIKSPSILPRSFSKRRSKTSERKRSANTEGEIKITVTVKDIIRWRSFPDLVDEKSSPLDLASSPHHCPTTTTTTTTTTTNGSTATTPSSSNGSSWCDSDFTSEYLPCLNGKSEECGENVVEAGKKYSPCVGDDSMEAIIQTKTTYAASGPKGEEKQQHSPVWVMDLEFEEDEESTPSFDQSLVNVERTKQRLMHKMRRFESLAQLDTVNLGKWMSMDENSSSREYEDDEEGEETNTIYEEEEEEEEATNAVEEKGWQLLNHVKETSSLGCCEINVDQLLLDFLRDELRINRHQNRIIGESDCEMINKAKAWMNGENSLWIGWEVEHKWEGYVRDMDKGDSWGKFEEEQEELAFVIENGMLDLLINDLLFDLISGCSIKVGPFKC